MGNANLGRLKLNIAKAEMHNTLYVCEMGLRKGESLTANEWKKQRRALCVCEVCQRFAIAGLPAKPKAL